MDLRDSVSVQRVRQAHYSVASLAGVYLLVLVFMFNYYLCACFILFSVAFSLLWWWFDLFGWTRDPLSLQRVFETHYSVASHRYRTTIYWVCTIIYVVYLGLTRIKEYMFRLTHANSIIMIDWVFYSSAAPACVCSPLFIGLLCVPLSQVVFYSRFNPRVKKWRLTPWAL